jgi:hypothetical protein
MTPDPLKPFDWRFFLLFIPAAYASYLFHEFGHWSVGEILGNRMVFSLNLVWPKNGHFLQASHALYSSIGGPGFSILQAALAWIVIEKFKTLYAYPFAFFPMFSRFFSDFLGGFEKQDEAGMAAMMGTWKYLPAVIVLAILLAIIIRCSYRLNLDARTNGYVLTASTIGQLLVIGTYTCFRI